MELEGSASGAEEDQRRASPSPLGRLILLDLQRHFDAPQLKNDRPLVLLMLDFLIGLFLFTPLIILTFRASWQMWDVILIHLVGCGILQSSLSALVGWTVLFLLCLLRHNIQTWTQVDLSGPPCRPCRPCCPCRLCCTATSKQVKRCALTRALVVVSLSCETLLWRGLWETIDYLDLFKDGDLSHGIAFAVLAVSLMAVSSFNVCHCTPIGRGFTVDFKRRNNFVIATALKEGPDAPLKWKLLDALLTMTLEMSAVVIYHCIWILFEHLQFESLGYTFMILTSMGLVLLAFTLQLTNLYIHAKGLPFVANAIAHEGVLFVTLIADAALFFSLWILIDSFTMPDETLDDEIGVLRRLKLTGAGPNQTLVSSDDFERTHLNPNMTVYENCKELVVRLQTSWFWDLPGLILGLSVLMAFGISSTLLFGVKREYHRHKEGIMVPRFYLSYLLRSDDDGDERVLSPNQ